MHNSPLLELFHLMVLMSEEEINPDSEYFDCYFMKSCVYRSSETLARYVVTNNIRNIAFMDCSMRPAWVGFDMYWNMHYPNIPKPKMYFFNPDGFNKWGARKEFERTFKQLVKEKSAPILLHDSCSHSGRTFRTVSKLLCKLKFKDIRVLTAKEPGFIQLPNPVKVVYTRFLGSDAACRLYGPNYFVAKGTKVVCDRDRESVNDRRMGIRIRQEIREIIASGPYYYNE